MMKKRLLMSLAVLMGLTSAMATDRITSSDFGISQGETKIFGIKLLNEGTNYVGFQMDLTLPEGLTLNKTGCSLSARITDENQELTIGKQSDYTYRLTSTSLSLTPISGTIGDLITVSVTASDTYQGGNATISNIQFATSNSERITMNDVTFAANCIITFADEQVKALCVANWDTNGDGELDTEEASAVTSLGSVFQYNDDISSFDELQYFTGLTGIGEYAFNGCSGLTSVTIPNSVTSIGFSAFYGCSSLTSIELPNSVTFINQQAFRNCSSLTSIELSNSVTSIEAIAFEGCSSLASITIPESVMSIGERAFNGCSGLISVTIPNSITSIGGDAFDGTAWYSNMPDGLIYLGKVAYKYKGTMPENTSIAIEQGTVEISSSAFTNCSGLTSVAIPNSVTGIGEAAFMDCTGLTSITIPEGVKSIGNRAFGGCSGLTSIEVEEGNMEYDSRNNCNAIIMKNSNILIAGCQNTVIPNSVTAIGDYAFDGCSGLTSFAIPNSVTRIDWCAFERCSRLISITIPNSVTDIAGSAFHECSSLTSITIPESVINIGSAAFWACPELTKVIILSPVPVTIGNLVFPERMNSTLYVPKNSKTEYAAADVWKEFKAIKEFPDPDVNQDGFVDVVDVVDVARFVVGTPSESFDEFLADLNGSGEVNVADAVVLVNEIAGDVNWSRSLRAAEVNNDILTLTRNVDQSLSFSLDGNSAYTAFQFDLMMPKEMDVTQMRLNSQRKKNHMLLYNKICEGHYRVVALSTSNQSFNGTADELLCMAFNGQPSDGITIDDIHFVTPQGNDLQFSAIGISGETPTSISDVKNNANDSDGKIYNLNGQRLTKAQKGLYIINGKKIMVK